MKPKEQGGVTATEGRGGARSNGGSGLVPGWTCDGSLVVCEGRDTVNSASVVSSSILPRAVWLSPGGHGGSTAEERRGGGLPLPSTHTNRPAVTPQKWSMSTETQFAPTR